MSSGSGQILVSGVKARSHANLPNTVCAFVVDKRGFFWNVRCTQESEKAYLCWHLRPSQTIVQQKISEQPNHKRDTICCLTKPEWDTKCVLQETPCPRVLRSGHTEWPMKAELDNTFVLPSLIRRHRCTKFARNAVISVSLVVGTLDTLCVPQWRQEFLYGLFRRRRHKWWRNLQIPSCSVQHGRWHWRARKSEKYLGENVVDSIANTKNSKRSAKTHSVVMHVMGFSWTQTNPAGSDTGYSWSYPVTVMMWCPGVVWDMRTMRFWKAPQKPVWFLECFQILQGHLL